MMGDKFIRIVYALAHKKEVFRARRHFVVNFNRESRMTLPEGLRNVRTRTCVGEKMESFRLRGIVSWLIHGS